MDVLRLGLVLGIALALPVPGARAQDPFPGGPGTQIGGGLPALYESSGAVWHPRLHRLFIVDDQGNLTMLDADGAVLGNWFVGGDLEGVTVADPRSPFVYLGLEHPDGVIEFDLVAGAATRLFDLTATLSGPENRGLEALTFARDPSHPEGGSFYAGLQDDGRIYEFELPIRSSSTATAVSHTATLVPAPLLDDISGLDWVAATDTLFATYDDHDEVIELDRAGSVLGSWVLPGSDQEGIALRGCRLFVTQDTGEVVRYEGFPSIGHCDALTIDVASISLAAGGSQTLAIDFGAAWAGSRYHVVGTRTDTLPGVVVGGIVVPVVKDGYFWRTLRFPNEFPLVASTGLLDADGRATAEVSVPAGTNPSVAGTVVYHATVLRTDSTVLATSNPTPLTLLP